MPDTTQSDNHGAVGALSQLAYGDGSSPMSQLPDLLKNALPPENDAAAENLSFWGGFSSNKDNLGGSITGALGNAMQAQSATRLERDKLRAAYMPLIMQSLIQNQQMTLSAGNAQRDWLEKVNPKIDAHMAALRTGDNVPTYDQAVEQALKVGQQYQLPPGIMRAHIASIPKDPAELKAYLDQMAVAQAGTKELMPTIGKNATDQNIILNPVKGTTSTLRDSGTTGQVSGDLGLNPDKIAVKWKTDNMGDPAKYEEGLRSESSAWDQALARLNPGLDYMKNFTPGKYANVAGGLAAAIKDIGEHIPGVDPARVKQFAEKLVNAPEGSTESIAARQAFTSMMAQEAVNQLKATEGDKPRFTNAEINVFNKTGVNALMTPEAVNLLVSTATKRGAEASNKYSAFNDYKKANPTGGSVSAFDAPYSSGRMGYRLEGKTGVYQGNQPGKLTDTQHPATLAAPDMSKTGAAKPAGQVDLTKYEAGSIVGPTGKVLVKDPSAKYGFRVAKPK